MQSGFIFVFAAFVVIILSVLAYAILAVFFPEWVGITGKVALEAEKSHQESSDKSDKKD